MVAYFPCGAAEPRTFILQCWGIPLCYNLEWQAKGKRLGKANICSHYLFQTGWIAAIGPPRKVSFVFIPPMGKYMKWHDKGSGGFYPTNPDLANILGRKDVAFDTFYFLIVWIPKLIKLGPGFKCCLYMLDRVDITLLSQMTHMQCLKHAKKHFLHTSMSKDERFYPDML